MFEGSRGPRKKSENTNIFICNHGVVNQLWRRRNHPAIVGAILANFFIYITFIWHENKLMEKIVNMSTAVRWRVLPASFLLVT